MTGKIIAFLLILSGTAVAAGQSTAAHNQKISADTIASSPSPAPANGWKEELDRLQAELSAQAALLENQRQQIEHQQAEIERMRARFASTAPEAAPREQESAATKVEALRNEARALMARDASPVSPSTARSAANAPPAQLGTESPGAPLSFPLGKASLTPGGWVDFTSYFRTSDVGSGLGTAFASIPFGNTVQGGLSETRFTAQNSRITLRADESFGATRVFGYAEADFNGYLPGNAYVSTNSDSMRLRVYFTDLARGRWEVLGGQSWSLLTPNRAGVSPFLSEIYNTMHLDTNYQVGLTYARQTQLRAVFHVTRDVALGVSAENPEQYAGGGVTFPALFNTGQADVGSSTGAGGGTATPTLHPDVIAKLSADAGWSGRHWHFETAGLLTPVAILTPASVTQSAAVKDAREGGGISGAANLEVAPNLHLIFTGFWSDGGGRYIGGLGPGFVVAQRGGKTAPFVAELVHAGSGIAAAEWRANRATVVSLTFSGAYFGRAFSTDPSTGALVGYGFAGSASSNNRALREETFATQTTLWKQAGYGSVQMITQSSYVMRTPWWVETGAPREAHVFVGYGNLRYVLP